MGFKKSFGEKFGEKLGEGTGNGINRVSKSFWDTVGELFSLLKPRSADASKGETWFKKNSFLLGFYVLAFGMLSLGKCSSPQDVGNTVSATGNLTIGKAPVMPADNRFDPTRSEFIQTYFVHDGIRYIRYRIMPDGKTTWVVVPSDTPYCVLIPKEEKVLLVSKIPPRYVVNMENEVHVGIRIAHYPSFFKRMFMRAIHPFSKDTELFSKTTTWKWVKNNWISVDKQDSGILVQANKKHPGGLVCF